MKLVTDSNITMNNNIQKVEVELSFTDNNIEMTCISAYLYERTLYVEFMSEETGEILTSAVRDLDDTTAIEICKQFNIATGIDVDYRNI